MSALLGSAALTLLLAAGGLPAAAAKPAVARPSFPIDGEIQTRGVVFFVEADVPAGAAAIGTAHTFDLGKLGEVKRGQFLLGHSRRVAGSTGGFLVPPGKPFNAPGATIADDYAVYALEERPTEVRLLTLATGEAPRRGKRVRILGVPSSLPRDEDALFGTIAESSDESIEVDLDVAHDLRGWGGSPIVDDGSGEVIGVLQAYFPRGSTARAIASPIARVRDALAKPLEAGRGRSFAKLAPRPKRRARRASSGRGSTVGGDYTPRQERLLRQPDAATAVHVEVEYPPEGAVLGDSACGTFVAGRALAHHGDLQRFDVVLVLDTSRSTIDPTGADINGNGIVGKPYLGRIGSIFDVGSTDPGDSILAAEVAAARKVLEGLDPRSTRVGVVVFSGEPPDVQGGLFVRGTRAPAITLEPLTNEFPRVHTALDDILARDPAGSTHMAAGVDQATVELLGLRGALSEPDSDSEKIVLFFTDGQPTLPYGPGMEADNNRAVQRAAGRADRAEIRIHSFAIGPEALEGPLSTVEMAEITDGTFTPVRHPGDLVDIVDQVNFANIETVELRSATTGEPAELFRTTADGSWAGFVRLEPGANEIEVIASATDATRESRRVRVAMEKGAPEPVVPEILVAARNRLLEDCLAALKQVTLQAERERADEVRKQLMVDIEREREAARERAAEQRKRLKLGVEADD